MEIKGAEYSINLSKNVRAFLPTLIPSTLIFGWSVYSNTVDQMPTVLLLFVVFVVLAPSLYLHLEYLANDWKCKLTVDKFSRKIRYVSETQEIVASFSEVRGIVWVRSIWNYLPFSNYYYFVIELEDKREIRISCLSTLKFDVGNKSIEELRTNFPLLKNPF